MLEIGQEFPEASTHIQPGFPESSKKQEKVKTTSDVTEAPTPNSRDTNEPRTDHTPIITDLMSYEVVGDGHALEQKVSDVSTTFQLLAVYLCA